MEPKRYSISPRTAIATACIGAASLVAAIAMRPEAPSSRPAAIVTPPLPGDAGVPDAEPPVAQSAMPSPPPPPSTPPTIDGVKVKTAILDQGVDLQIDTALTLAAMADRREDVRIKASCQLDGEWFAGTGSIWLSKLPAGTSTVQQKITLGAQHVFRTAPSQCQIGFEYTSFATRPMQRQWLAKKCWDGKTLGDAACATKPNTNVAVSTVRVATSLDRYRSRRAGSPVDLEVSLDAEIKQPLDDWQLEVAADCVLPDGTTQHANERVYTRDVHAGRPFTSRAYLFRGKQQMIDLPESCTLAIEVADRQQLVREAVASWCWRDGSVVAGACHLPRSDST